MRPAGTTPAIPHPAPANNAKLPSTCKAEMELSRLAYAVDIAYAVHNQIHGSTVSLFDGNMAGKKLFAVSIYPARTVELWESPTRQELFDFAQANAKLLVKPRHAIGTWFDDWKQVHVLDVVILVANRDLALKLARKSRQTAIFDLEARREIAVSSPSDMLSTNYGGGVNG